MIEMYWEIEPYHSSEADICKLPANTDEDHWEALKYAKDRLEELWDDMEVGEEGVVKIRLVKDKE